MPKEKQPVMALLLSGGGNPMIMTEEGMKKLYEYFGFDAEDQVDQPAEEIPMIANENQYEITKAALKKFEQALEGHKTRQPSPDVHPRIHQAMGDAMQSQVQILRQQIEEYENRNSK